MLEIKKETTITIYTTDNKPILKGDLVLLESAGKTHVGTYNGFVKSGAINFTANYNEINVSFNIMPKSIDKIYLISLN